MKELRLPPEKIRVLADRWSPEWSHDKLIKEVIDAQLAYLAGLAREDPKMTEMVAGIITETYYGEDWETNEGVVKANKILSFLQSIAEARQAKAVEAERERWLRLIKEAMKGEEDSFIVGNIKALIEYAERQALQSQAQDKE